MVESLPLKVYPFTFKHIIAVKVTSHEAVFSHIADDHPIHCKFDINLFNFGHVKFIVRVLYFTVNMHKSELHFSCIPDKVIRVFHLCLQILSHPCYLTRGWIKITCI